MSVNDCKLIDLQTIVDSSGELTVVESGRHIAFDIKRIYYLHGVSATSERGSHAHKELRQLIIPISGSFDVDLFDGINKKKYSLRNPNVGLFVCPMIWRDIKNFSSNAVCLVLASALYDEEDYLRNYNDFLDLLRP